MQIQRTDAEPNPYETWAATPGGWDGFTDELGDDDAAAGCSAGSVELHQVKGLGRGKLCSACRGPLPAQDMIREDQYGWLWCETCAQHCATCDDPDCDHPRAVLIPWSADYGAGYVDGRADAWSGREQRDVSRRPEGYRAGCRAGWAWAVDHPYPAREAR